MIITLDGPAGSGKSTVARLLAKRLELEFLDTGAMYRGLTAHCMDSGVDPVTDEEAVIEAAEGVELRFTWTADPPRLTVDGRDVTHRLRDPDVTRRVSHVAAMREVRRVMVANQQRIGREHPRLVTEGRDQGSVVFPSAHAKFYLDASPPVRAGRRADQMRHAGRTDVDEKQILNELLQRDHRDSSRSDGPLICPEDAQRVDTSEMSLEQVVDYLECQVRHQFKQRP